MTDPLVAAAGRFIAEGAATLRRAADGLAAELLNLRPAGDDTNSIAVLTTHAMSATRLWVSAAVDTDRPDRHRAAEFETEASDAATLIALIDEFETDTQSWLDDPDSIDWSSMRVLRRDDGSTFEVTAGFALLHAVEHLQAHAAEAALTRHVIAPG